VGLIAAFVLSVHPFLIQLSARGLREEWFSVLLLLFVHYGYVKSSLAPWLRVAVSGLLAGCILLTRSECLPMIVILLLLYPLLAGRRWNYATAIIALLLGVSLWLPHQYSMYREHGDFFYTANQYARFYTNREFAGKPGFPTREEVRVKGMYYGPKITPLSFYCGLHSPWQLASGSLLGFAKIHLKMPLSFISGRGNAAAVLYSITSIKEEPRFSKMLSFMGLAGKLLIDTWWANVMGCSVLLAFLLGLILLGIFRCWLMYVYLILFQLHTSFLAYLGLDERLCVQSYPLIALCCGFSLYVLYSYRTGKSRLSQGICSCGVNTVS